MKTEMNFNLR